MHWKRKLDEAVFKTLRNDTVIEKLQKYLKYILMKYKSLSRFLGEQKIMKITISLEHITISRTRNAGRFSYLIKANIFEKVTFVTIKRYHSKFNTHLPPKRMKFTCKSKTIYTALIFLPHKYFQ
jgi:hypothetical protein